LKYIGKKMGQMKKKKLTFSIFKNKKKFYDDEEVEPIDTEYELLPIRWDERIYLMIKTN